MHDKLTSHSMRVMLHSLRFVPVPELTACSKIFRFGLFEADGGQKTLLRNGMRVKLQDQPLRVLLFLLERPGEIVTREELKQRLWPEGTFVDFDGSLNVILKKLRAAIDDDSDNPRFVETVPRRGYRFIAPVTESENRLVAAPQVSLRQSNALPPRLTEKQSNISSRILLATCLTLLLLLAIVGVFRLRERPAPITESTSPFTTVSVPIRQSIAVLGFHNLSNRPDDAWLSTAFAEMLSTELAGDGKLRLVPGEDVASLRLSEPWSQSDTLDQKTTARIGTELSSDLLVLGSYTVLGSTLQEDIRLDVRLQDAKTGQILTEFSELGTRQELFQLVSRVGDRLRDRLGISRLEETDLASILSALPLDPEAARLYALGIAKLRQFDALAARDLLEQAVKVDPKFSLAHAMLAQALGQLGYAQKASAEAKRALDLSADLPQAERMQVQGQYYENIGHHEQASSIYRALFSLYPDNVDYGLLLAKADIESGHGSQAMGTLKQLRHLPPPSSQDPRIDLAEAGIAKSIPEALSLIERAVNTASQLGSKVLYAQARRDQCRTLLYSDRPQEATAACRDAYDVFLSTGNRAAAADTVRLTADYEGSTSHVDEALATYQRALNLVEGLGEHEKTGAILNNMAIVLTNEGKLDRAEQLYREAQSHFALAGNVGNSVTALVNIADISYLRGKLQAAEKIYQQALELETQLDPSRPGYVLYRLADLELTEGKLKEARLHAEQANTALQKDNGAYQYMTSAIDELGDILEQQGDLDKARQLFEQSLAIRKKMGETGLVAESLEELAQISLEEGNPERAEPVLHGVISEFEKEHGDPDASTAYILLSRVLREEGKLNEAAEAAKRAADLSLTSSDPALRLPAAIEGARIEAAMSRSNGRNAAHPSGAIQSLNSAAAAAKRLGYFNVECEARLALGEIETRLNPATGRTLLTSLAVEARNHGLELLARHAEQSMKDSGSEFAVSRSVH